MKKGIKRRVVWSYLILIIFSVALFETMLIFALRVYYLDGVKQVLRDQGTMFSTFYEQELIEDRLKVDPETMLDQYRFLVEAQVQLVDEKGNLIADSHEYTKINMSDYTDIKTALGGLTGYLDTELDEERVLVVTQPLKRGSTVIGAIRFTTSLEQVNKVFTQNTLFLLSFGGVVILTAAIISYFLANTITKPVSAITLAAQQMASGKLSTRIPKEKDDEIGKLADTLNYMAKEIERHEQLKNEFIASVSHELRTPLTSIKGWAITLQSMSADRFFHDGLDIISKESDRLNGLLNELLDFSSLSSGRLPLVFKNVSLASLIQQVVQQLEPRAKRQGLTFSAVLDPEAGEINGDQNRLKQVLMNLLDNAFKFTPSNGRITVELKRGDDVAVIMIHDTGIGISEAELKLVRDKFYKGKSKSSGSGLGLAIVDEIIQAHNGYFSIISKEGMGTTAEIGLPLDKIHKTG